MAFSVGYVVLFFLVVSLALFTPLMVHLAYEDFHSNEALHSANLLLYLHKHFWPAALLALVIIVFHSLRVSHRIAGPLYRFNAIFATLQQGILPKPAHLRHGDYLMPHMETINGALQTLRTHLGDLQAAHSQLHDAMHACVHMAPHASPQELMDGLKYVAEHEQALADTLASFHIEA
jgi:hypothetical protein